MSSWLATKIWECIELVEDERVSLRDVFDEPDDEVSRLESGCWGAGVADSESLPLPLRVRIVTGRAR